MIIIIPCWAYPYSRASWYPMQLVLIYDMKGVSQRVCTNSCFPQRSCCWTVPGCISEDHFWSTSNIFHQRWCKAWHTWSPWQISPLNTWGYRNRWQQPLRYTLCNDLHSCIFTFLESGDMSVDKVHQLVNFLPNPDLLVGVNRQPLLDFIDLPTLALIQWIVHISDDLLPEILEVIVEFFQGIVSLFFLALEHHVPLLLEVAFPFV